MSDVLPIDGGKSFIELFSIVVRAASGGAAKQLSLFVSSFQQELSKMPPLRDNPMVLPCIALMLCLSAGCSGGNKEGPSVEVSGTVTLDDALLQEGSIQFTSRKTGESAYAEFDSSGHYSMTLTDVEFGTEYDVTVGPKVLGYQEVPDDMEKQLASDKVEIPRRYSSRTKSGLKVTIEREGNNEFNFDLKSR